MILPKTLDEVGAALGVTRERIRQIEAKAMYKLRHPSRSTKLVGYLEAFCRENLTHEGRTRLARSSEFAGSFGYQHRGFYLDFPTTGDARRMFRTDKTWPIAKDMTTPPADKTPTDLTEYVASGGIIEICPRGVGGHRCRRCGVLDTPRTPIGWGWPRPHHCSACVILPAPTRVEGLERGED